MAQGWTRELCQAWHRLPITISHSGSWRLQQGRRVTAAMTSFARQQKFLAFTAGVGATAALYVYTKVRQGRGGRGLAGGQQRAGLGGSTAPVLPLAAASATACAASPICTVSNGCRRTTGTSWRTLPSSCQAAPHNQQHQRHRCARRPVLVAGLVSRMCLSNCCGCIAATS